MTVLQCGFERSGNYWLWRLIGGIFDAAGEPRRSFIRSQPIHSKAVSWEFSAPGLADADILHIYSGRPYCVLPPHYRIPLDDIDGYIAQNSHIWSHMSAQEAKIGLLSKFDKIVYIVRDPRDALVSLAHWRFTPFWLKQADPGASSPVELMIKISRNYFVSWRRHVAGYLYESGRLPVHILFYEDMLRDTRRAVELLSAHLGLRPGADNIESLTKSTAYSSFKKTGAAHFESGRSGNWRAELPEPALKHCMRESGELLQRIGYAKKRAEDAGPLSLKFSLDARTIRYALR